MATLPKEEFPPLLPAGFHPMTLAELRKLCVDCFPLSTSRDSIMDGLERIVAKLKDKKVEGDIWVDGSFLTEKINPKDSDIVLHVQGLFYDNAELEQQEAIDWVRENLKAALDCDSYVFMEYPKSHPWGNESEWDKAYWVRQFGFSRGQHYKGMVLIRL